jgi:hypothetical protein
MIGAMAFETRQLTLTRTLQLAAAAVVLVLAAGIAYAGHAWGARAAEPQRFHGVVKTVSDDHTTIEIVGYGGTPITGTLAYAGWDRKPLANGVSVRGWYVTRPDRVVFVTAPKSRRG